MATQSGGAQNANITNTAMQAMQTLNAEKQRGEQQGLQMLCIIKGTIIPSIMPEKVDWLNIYSGSLATCSFLNALTPSGMLSIYKEGKPATIFWIVASMSQYNIHTMLQKMAEGHSEPDKFGQDYQLYQQKEQELKPLGYEAMQKQMHDKQEQQKHHSDGHGGGHKDEMAKYSEGERNRQHQNHNDRNHNNHYNATHAWKHTAEMMKRLYEINEMHMRSLQKMNRDNDEAVHKERQAEQRKRHR